MAGPGFIRRFSKKAPPGIRLAVDPSKTAGPPENPAGPPGKPPADPRALGDHPAPDIYVWALFPNRGKTSLAEKIGRRLIEGSSHEAIGLMPLFVKISDPGVIRASVLIRDFA